MIFRLGELFCGPGGLAWGARMAGTVRGADGEVFSIRHAWATDYDEATCRTYGFNICGDEKARSVVCADVRQLDLRVLKGILEIDGLAFGFSCNDFSLMGEQRGANGTFDPLYQTGGDILGLLLSPCSGAHFAMAA